MRTSIITFILIIGIAFSVNAQENKSKIETEYLFKDDDSKGLRFSTFYGEIAPATAFATISNSLGKVFMTEFGIHLNRRFTIGYYLARSPKTNVINVPGPSDPEYQDWIDSGVELDQLPTGSTQAYAYFSHTGINLAYMHKTEKTVFWRAGFRFGSGKLQLNGEKKQLFDLFSTPIYEVNVLNFNPEVGVGINLRSWWRIHADIGYHFVFSGSDEVLNPEQFDGATFKFGFAFGNFAK